MRNIRILLLSALVCFISASCSSQRVLSDLSSMKGVTSVYVGKAMLQMAGSSIGMDQNSGGVDVSELINDLTSIEIVTCENKKMASSVQKKCNSILSQYPFELITEVTSDDEKVEISGVFDKDSEIINMLLISVVDDDEPTYILMTGKIDMNSLNAALPYGSSGNSVEEPDLDD